MQIIDGVLFVPGVGFNSNIYIVGKDEIGIIDSGASPNYISHVLDKMKEYKLQQENVKKLILTHIHPDHTGGVSGFVQAFNPEIYVHVEASIPFIKKYGDKLRVFKGGETLTIDTFSFQVIHTPGHSPGGICLYEADKKLLFSGDTVFSHGNIGRTDLRGGNSGLLIQSIEELMKLDVEYLCPGHMPAVRDGNVHIKHSYTFAKMVF